MDTVTIVTVTAACAGSAVALLQLFRLRDTAQDARDAMLSAEREAAAYRETLDRLGGENAVLAAENAALRAEILERCEEQALLEQELQATKAALATEESQADIWARTATSLGYTAGAPAIAAMGVAA